MIAVTIHKIFLLYFLFASATNARMNDNTSNNTRSLPQHKQNFSIEFHDDKVFWHIVKSNSHFIIQMVHKNNFQSERNAYAVAPLLFEIFAGIGLNGIERFN